MQKPEELKLDLAPLLGSKSVTMESMSESPQKNRISVKTSIAEKMNSKNGSPCEIDHDTSQLARRAQPCCIFVRRFRNSDLGSVYTTPMFRPKNIVEILLEVGKVMSLERFPILRSRAGYV
ncbi:hypothetical protein F2Q69_00009760 [Brassica cretica]|uniref:Uncharacterized protein n=1 Tax=Brassica cretica TaxID=69181 RepID=A0A8S9P8H8_BRACR|nr:hypothetical protein F2Q69_00009760 [Brassica cretica]